MGKLMVIYRMLDIGLVQRSKRHFPAAIKAAGGIFLALIAAVLVTGLFSGIFELKNMHYPPAFDGTRSNSMLFEDMVGAFNLLQTVAILVYIIAAIAINFQMSSIIRKMEIALQESDAQTNNMHMIAGGQEKVVARLRRLLRRLRVGTYFVVGCMLFRAGVWTIISVGHFSQAAQHSSPCGPGASAAVALKNWVLEAPGVLSLSMMCSEVLAAVVGVWAIPSKAGSGVARNIGVSNPLQVLTH